MKAHHLALSFGGTKLAAALFDQFGEPLRLSPRLEWRQHPAFVAEHSGRTVVRLAWRLCRDLMKAERIDLRSVNRVGFAWPGPGAYRQGRVSATFIPGFEQPRSLFDLFAETIAEECESAHLRYTCYLDAVARAIGETVLSTGIFYRWRPEENDCALLLNVATGIAGAVVTSGGVLREHAAWGETYGQWGRYLFNDRVMGNWRWQPTIDGRIVSPVPNGTTRFTALCGGPAVARRWAQIMVAEMRDIEPASRSLARRYLAADSRDTATEYQLLSGLTSAVHAGEPSATACVQETGRSIGGAIRCLVEHLPLPGVRRLALAGGIGENLAVPVPGQRDILIEAIAAEMRSPDIEVVRCQNGLRSELRGVV